MLTAKQVAQDYFNAIDKYNTIHAETKQNVLLRIQEALLAFDGLEDRLNIDVRSIENVNRDVVRDVWLELSSLGLNIDMNLSPPGHFSFDVLMWQKE